LFVCVCGGPRMFYPQMSGIGFSGVAHHAQNEGVAGTSIYCTKDKTASRSEQWQPIAALSTCFASHD